MVSTDIPRIESLQSGLALDGVYLDTVCGVNGTDWPRGTPRVPVNNMTDAIAIMTYHNLKKLYLIGARTYEGVHTGANNPTVMTDNVNTFVPNTLIGLTIWNDDDGSDGVIIANGEHTVTVAALVGGGANIWTTGDHYYITADSYGHNPYRVIFNQNIDLELVSSKLYDIEIADGVTVNFVGDVTVRRLTNSTGYVRIWGNCHVADHLHNTSTGEITIYGNCRAGSITNITGSITVIGNCFVSGDIELTGVGTISIRGDCQSGNAMTNATGIIRVYGNCFLGGYMGQSNAGTIIIKGNCYIADGLSLSHPSGVIDITGIANIFGQIINSGTLSFKGARPEEMVSMSVISASETFFLDLPWKYGFRYVVDRVRLKCADPGANIVTVRLYEFVNWALIQTDSFDITTANFNKHFSLQDMFGLDKIAGDYTKISLRASAGGPYAVTGGYIYRIV